MNQARVALGYTAYPEYTYGGCGRGGLEEWYGPQQTTRRDRADEIEREVFGESTLWDVPEKIDVNPDFVDDAADKNTRPLTRPGEITEELQR